MPSKLKRRLLWRPSPALIISVIALIMATSGVGSAGKSMVLGHKKTERAAAAGKPFITGAHIVPNTIQTSDLSRAAVTALKGDQGPAGPQGQAGPAGPPGAGSTVAFASRDVGGSPEAVPVGAANAGVLNLDIPGGTAGYVSSSGVITATGPSRLVATADVT